MMQVHLTHREFQLLYLLDAHKGQVLEAGQLIEKIWGYTGQGDKNALRNLVRKLRAKLDEHADEESFIETIPNMGYRLR
ncbi:MAG: helix-turn-helix domain-containing protein [Caldilineaceae bacterium]